MGDTGNTTTTTTTTTTTKTTTTISINLSYLKPHGILKIVEILVCIIEFSLVASQRSALALLASVVRNSGYYQGPTFAMAVGIIFFLTTLLLLVLFLFNLADHVGGNKIWFTVDMILNILAAILFFISFIVLCVYCSYSTASATFLFDEIIVAAVFALVACVLYIVSLVFAMKAGQTPMITVKA